ncbi:MAG: hypothetical protein P8163_22320 [Candidatus Thiodiazotropha sp.]
MSVKKINERIPFYRQAFASGEIQKTYQSLVEVIQSIRTEFNKEYKSEFSIANLLHGYIDFTYFYMQNDFLKKRKLKIAIVLNHKEVRFELWLLGQTKDVQTNYWKKLQDVKWVDDDSMPEWSIFEIVLLANPDFDNIKELTDSLKTIFNDLSEEIFEALETHE